MPVDPFTDESVRSTIQTFQENLDHNTSFIYDEIVIPAVIAISVFNCFLVILFYLAKKNAFDPVDERKFTEEDAEWLRAHWKREAEGVNRNERNQ